MQLHIHGSIISVLARSGRLLMRTRLPGCQVRLTREGESNTAEIKEIKNSSYKEEGWIKIRFKTKTLNDVMHF